MLFKKCSLTNILCKCFSQISEREGSIFPSSFDGKMSDFEVTRSSSIHPLNGLLLLSSE